MTLKAYTPVREDIPNAIFLQQPMATIYLVTQKWLCVTEPGIFIHWDQEENITQGAFQIANISMIACCTKWVH